jgi:hypothetical protein
MTPPKSYGIPSHSEPWLCRSHAPPGILPKM